MSDIAECPDCGGPFDKSDQECANCGPVSEFEQGTLFDLNDLEWWRPYWLGMPEYVHEDLTPWKSIKVHFASRSDMDRFASLVSQKLTAKTQSIWYPEAEIGRYADKRYVQAADS